MDCSPPGSLPMGFSRQEYWSGLPFPSAGDLPDPGTELMSPASPALASGFLYYWATWESLLNIYVPLLRWVKEEEFLVWLWCLKSQSTSNTGNSEERTQSQTQWHSNALITALQPSIQRPGRLLSSPSLLDSSPKLSAGSWRDWGFSQQI